MVLVLLSQVPAGCGENTLGSCKRLKRFSHALWVGRGHAGGSRHNLVQAGLAYFSLRSADEVIKVHLGKEALFFFILFSLNFFLVFQITHTWHRKSGRDTQKAYIKYELDEECNEAWGEITYRPITQRPLFIFL